MNSHIFKKPIMHLNLNLIGSILILLVNCNIMLVGEKNIFEKDVDQRSSVRRNNAKSRSGAQKFPFLRLNNNALTTGKSSSGLKYTVHRPFRVVNMDRNRPRREIEFEDISNDDDNGIEETNRKYFRERQKSHDARAKEKYEHKKIRKFYIIGNHKKRLVTDKDQIDAIMYQDVKEPDYKGKSIIIISGIIGGLSLIMLVGCIVFLIIKKIGVPEPSYMPIKEKSITSDFPMPSSDIDEPMEKIDKIFYAEQSEVLNESENIPKRDVATQCLLEIDESSEKDELAKDPSKDNSFDILVGESEVTEKIVAEEQEKNDDDLCDSIIEIPEIDDDEDLRNKEMTYFSDESSSPYPLTDLIETNEFISSHPLEVTESQIDNEANKESFSYFPKEQQQEQCIQEKDLKLRKFKQKNGQRYIFDIRTRPVKRTHISKSKDKNSKAPEQKIEDSEDKESMSYLLPINSPIASRIPYSSEKDSKLPRRLKIEPNRNNNPIQAVFLDKSEYQSNQPVHNDYNEAVTETCRYNEIRNIRENTPKSDQSCEEWLRLRPRPHKEEVISNSRPPSTPIMAPQLLKLSKVQEWLESQPKTISSEEESDESDSNCLLFSQAANVGSTPRNSPNRNLNSQPFIPYDSPFLKIGSDKCLLFARRRQKREYKSSNKYYQQKKTTYSHIRPSWYNEI